MVEEDRRRIPGAELDMGYPAAGDLHVVDDPAGRRVDDEHPADQPESADRRVDRMEVGEGGDVNAWQGVASSVRRERDLSGHDPGRQLGDDLRRTALKPNPRDRPPLQEDDLPGCRAEGDAARRDAPLRVAAERHVGPGHRVALPGQRPGLARVEVDREHVERGVGIVGNARGPAAVAEDDEAGPVAAQRRPREVEVLCIPRTVRQARRRGRRSWPIASSTARSSNATLDRAPDVVDEPRVRARQGDPRRVEMGVPGALPLEADRRDGAAILDACADQCPEGIVDRDLARAKIREAPGRSGARAVLDLDPGNPPAIDRQAGRGILAGRPGVGDVPDDAQGGIGEGIEDRPDRVGPNVVVVRLDRDIDPEGVDARQKLPKGVDRAPLEHAWRRVVVGLAEEDANRRRGDL